MPNSMSSRGGVTKVTFRLTERFGALRNAAFTSVVAAVQPFSAAIRIRIRRSRASAPPALMLSDGSPSGFSRKFPHATMCAFLFPEGAFLVATNLPGIFSTGLPDFSIAKMSDWRTFLMVPVLIRFSSSSRRGWSHLLASLLTSLLDTV